jgi:twitching motility protein PilT
MVLRDADQIVLESGKIPSMRRRGQHEALAMPALDHAMIEEFARPLLAGKSLDDGPLMVSYADGDSAYQITIERSPSGLRAVARRAGKKSPPPTPSPSPSPSPSSIPTPTPAAPAPTPSPSPSPSSASLDRLHSLLSPAISAARSRAASDVFLSTGQPPRMRVDGRLESLDVACDDAELAACVAELGAGDRGLEVDGARVRANLFDHLNGAAIAARIIRERVPSIGELSLPADLATAIDNRDGLVLACGPTGSGKSTTLAALVDLLDQRRAAHVITIEDPIEYRFVPRRCLVHQRELGTHVPSFAAGLRAALREAPDVIVLGELRDRETIAAALTAAETGHLVLATLHAPNAVGAIDRIVDAFPEAGQRQIRGQLAASLRVVITQYLLPRTGGGRAVAVEYVPATAAVANIIRKGDLHTLATAIQSGRDVGMIPLERSLAKLADSGTVSRDAIRRVAADLDLLAALAGVGKR